MSHTDRRTASPNSKPSLTSLFFFYVLPIPRISNNSTFTVSLLSPRSAVSGCRCRTIRPTSRTSPFSHTLSKFSWVKKEKVARYPPHRSSASTPVSATQTLSSFLRFFFFFFPIFFFFSSRLSQSCTGLNLDSLLPFACTWLYLYPLYLAY